MTTTELEQQYAATCRNEWFKHHKAVCLALSDQVVMYSWQNPESWNYGCRFILHRRWLTVVGDIGEAVYEWGQDVTLDFLANCDLHYFFGKMQASEEGTKFTMFHSRIIRDQIKNREIDKRLIGAAKRLADCSGKYDITAAMSDEYNNSNTDPEELSALVDGATTIHPRCIGHWVGIKMVHEQLNPKV